GDHVRLADAYRDDKVEAVRRQSAQDQIEIAERVGRCAYAGQGAAGRIVTCTAGEAVGRGRAGVGGDQLAFGELRKQLGADLLKSLIINYAGGRLYPGAAPIDRHAHLNSDI